MKAYCDENDLPLLTVPWEVHLSDMIKDFSIHVFLQDTTDEQIASALIAAIETPDNQDAYRKDLLQYFDVDGSFQVLLMTCEEGLDSMDTVERKKAVLSNTGISGGYHSQWKLFYYNSDFVLVANALSEEYLCRLVEGAIKEEKRRCPGLNCAWESGADVWIFPSFR